MGSRRHRSRREYTCTGVLPPDQYTTIYTAEHGLRKTRNQANKNSEKRVEEEEKKSVHWRAHHKILVELLCFFCVTIKPSSAGHGANMFPTLFSTMALLVVSWYTEGLLKATIKSDSQEPLSLSPSLSSYDE